MHRASPSRAALLAAALLGLCGLTFVPATAVAQPAGSASISNVSSAPIPAGSTCPAGNLLAGKRPVHWTDIRGGWINRPTDGVVANEGAVWDAPLATVLETGASVLTWDLGQVMPVRALWVQGDANDYYTIWGSVDGNRYQDLGRVEPAEGVHGLRGRKLSLGGALVRYLRIGEGQGDSFYSISEVQAFCELPAAIPYQVRVEQAAAAVAAKTLWTYWNDATSIWVELFLALIGLGLLVWGAQLKREGRPDAHKRLRDRALAVLGVIAGLCYINFGSFHFGNFTHDWEWTHYYVGSKYFKQLSYDRLYECIAIADSEESSHLRRRVEMRKLTNLRTNALESSKPLLAHPEACKQNFTPQRWEEFKADVRFFRNRQNAKRWDDLQTDHGYNGTPVWNVAGTLLANTGPASTGQLYALAMLDPLYLLATIAVIWWAFGWRVLSVALLAFATNFPSRFYWTGGSYLRWDWLFYLTAGICCLRKDRPMLGGAALAYATLLRVFPGFIFIGPALGLGWYFYKHRKLEPRYARFFAGAALATALLVPLSLAVSGGTYAYQRFVQNTAKHKETPLTNYMGLRTVLAYRPGEAGRDLKNDQLTDPWIKWKTARLDRWKEAKPVYIPLVLAFIVLLGLAGRHVQPWVAAALGVTFIPMGVELTCYYYAFIIAVALLYEKREEVGIYLLFLTAFTSFIAAAPFKGMARWLDEQYTTMSLATVAVFALIVWRFKESETEPVELAEAAPETAASSPKSDIATRWHKRNKSKRNKG
jgi:hypothetical protein